MPIPPELSRTMLKLARALLSKGAAPAEPVAPADRKLLDEADDLIHTAKWAAGKLNVEMNLRRSMPSWRELEALTDQREAMADWTTRKRAAAPKAPTEPAAFLRDFINLCAVGDITEDSDDGLGWADLVKRAKAML
jgi:hypothetical protein